ncbi:MAG: molybdate ABC transporter substrate-binding protein [Acidobacteria bacterium]|nr:molybdate ABC transporter substrate-binding protein [Acidobacteriota bacterium]
MSTLSSSGKRFISLINSGLSHLLFFCLSALLLVSCASQQEPPALLVAAASDMVRVGPRLQAAFPAASVAELKFTFGPSGQLEQQIRQGAPFDVYLPAARSYADSLVRDGLAEGEVLVYGVGRLVVWSKSLDLNSLSDLRQEEITRIALANPRYAPYGLAAQQALQSAGVWQVLQPKLIYADSVSHAFQMAETGNADVALTALSLVLDSGRPFLILNQNRYSPIEQAAVVLRSSRNPRAAKAFLQFLKGNEARSILDAYGFGHP